MGRHHTCVAASSCTMTERISVLGFSLIVCVLSVQITDLRVPTAVRNGSASALLDCEYSLKPDEYNLSTGLVLKWYFNERPVPVYQWIIGQRPQDLGILQGRLDMSYRASNNNYTMHRALFITNPTVELSGDYRCVVSSFTDEDFMNKKMIVYVPETKFEMTTHVHLTGLTISCRVLGVFPEPQLRLYKGAMSRPEVDVIGVGLLEWSRQDKVMQHGLYGISGTALLTPRDLRAATEFICKLHIPATEYWSIRSTVYHPANRSSQLFNVVQLLLVTSLSSTLITTNRSRL